MAAGARDVAPIAFAALVIGMSYGILARDAGMGVVAPIVMSLTTFAGSAQMAAATVMQDGGAAAAAVTAAILLNLRYMAIGVSVAPSLRGRRARRLAEAQLATDESWAISQDSGRVNRERMLGAGLVLLVAWTVGTVAGVFGGSALGDPADLRVRRHVPRALPRPPRRPARRRTRAGCGTGGRADRAHPHAGGAARRAHHRRRGRRPDRPQAPEGGDDVSTTWMIVLIVGAATVALKGLAPVLLGDRELPAPVARVNGALAPALLAALVAVQTVGDGASLTLDPRVAGVAAAVVALLLRAPLLVVLISSAGVAAAVNALT